MAPLSPSYFEFDRKLSSNPQSETVLISRCVVVHKEDLTKDQLKGMSTAFDLRWLMPCSLCLPPRTAIRRSSLVHSCYLVDIDTIQPIRALCCFYCLSTHTHIFIEVLPIWITLNACH